jgi:hypothetical protein
MRAALVGLITAVGLAALPVAAQAAPMAQAPGIVGPTAGIVQIAGGCGPGFRPAWWRDRWGRPHRRCVPFGGYGRPYYRPY